MRLPKLIKDTILQSKIKAGNQRQYRTILSADTASEARQLLSQKRR